MVAKPATPARRAGPAQIESQDRVTEIEEVARARPYIRTVLTAGEAVNHDDERPIAVCLNLMERAEQSVAAFVAHGELDPLPRTVGK